jgi:CRP-like cAMP-binding protein/N-acyl-L-homoserine lactone synthetase
MSIRVFIASSDEDREAIYRFRYRIYVDELGLSPPEADHTGRRLCDTLDAQGVSYGLIDDDGQVLGSLRCLFVADLPDPAPLVAKFAMAPAIAAFGREGIVTTSRFMLDPRLRHGKAILQLMRAPYEDGRARGIRLNYGDCSPHLLPFYESMGYRRYTSAYNDTAYGFKLPIVMLVGDRQHFASVRSPLARLAERFPEDEEARRWFAETYPRWGQAGSAALLPSGAFFDLLVERVASDPLHAVELFRGLSRQEADRFLASATLVSAAAGDRIVRAGERDDTVYLLLEGLADVVRPAPAPEPPGSASNEGTLVATLGAGDLFGEIGFLTATPRTASVIARAPCQLVVLSGRFLQKLLAEEPALAARVMYNLARILAARLAQTTLRLPGPDTAETGEDES